MFTLQHELCLFTFNYFIRADINLHVTNHFLPQRNKKYLKRKLTFLFWRSWAFRWVSKHSLNSNCLWWDWQVKHMIKCFVAEVEIKLILTCPVEFETDSQVIVLTRYILPTFGTLGGILAPGTPDQERYWICDAISADGSQHFCRAWSRPGSARSASWKGLDEGHKFLLMFFWINGFPTFGTSLSSKRSKVAVWLWCGVTSWFVWARGKPYWM